MLRLSGGQGEGERERENEAGVSLTASCWLAACLFAWPVACMFACLPSCPTRCRRACLLSCLAMHSETREWGNGTKRERESGREKGIRFVFVRLAGGLAICLASWPEGWPNSWVAGWPARWLLSAWLSGMPLCMHACVPACLDGLTLGCLPPPSRCPCIFSCRLYYLLECPRQSDGEKKTTTRAREGERGGTCFAGFRPAGWQSVGWPRRERERETDGMMPKLLLPHLSGWLLGHLLVCCLPPLLSDSMPACWSALLPHHGCRDRRVG